MEIKKIQKYSYSKWNVKRWLSLWICTWQMIDKLKECIKEEKRDENCSKRVRDSFWLDKRVCKMFCEMELELRAEVACPGRRLTLICQNMLLPDAAVCQFYQNFFFNGGREQESFFMSWTLTSSLSFLCFCCGFIVC